MRLHCLCAAFLLQVLDFIAAEFGWRHRPLRFLRARPVLKAWDVRIGLAARRVHADEVVICQFRQELRDRFVGRAAGGGGAAAEKQRVGRGQAVVVGQQQQLEEQKASGVTRQAVISRRIEDGVANNAVRHYAHSSTKQPSLMASRVTWRVLAFP